MLKLSNLNPFKRRKDRKHQNEHQHRIAQRDILIERRDRILTDIPQLEEKEQILLQQGRATSQQTTKRRLAVEINHLRKTISRQTTQAAFIGKQIETLETDIHNVSLINEGKNIAGLELDQDTLTSHAVDAEQIMEEICSQAEIQAVTDMGISDAERDILKEFEVPLTKPAKSEEEQIMREFETRPSQNLCDHPTEKLMKEKA